MNVRLIAGAFLCYLYNNCIGKIPSRKLRRFYLRRYLGSMGSDCGIQMGCRFLNGRKIHLGHRCIINFDTLMDGRIYSIRIGNDVSIGPEATILTLGHDPKSCEFADQGAPVIIGDNVWIAYRAVILPGVTIGEGAVIAAGAVVSRDIPAYSIAAGVPAKVIGERPQGMDYKLKYDPWLL